MVRRLKLASSALLTDISILIAILESFEIRLVQDHVLQGMGRFGDHAKRYFLVHSCARDSSRADDGRYM